jgi:hypothetical protein
VGGSGLNEMLASPNSRLSVLLLALNDEFSERRGLDTDVSFVSMPHFYISSTGEDSFVLAGKSLSVCFNLDLFERCGR